jgi:hypothetical protein
MKNIIKKKYAMNRVIAVGKLKGIRVVVHPLMGHKVYVSRGGLTINKDGYPIDK